MRLPRAAAWNTCLVQRESQQYEPDEDPDTEAATTPEEVEGDTERDQAEGAEEPEQSTG